MLTRDFFEIDISVKLLGPLHISGKSDPFSTVHNSMARVGEDVTIPGPSFKGAFRVSLENLLIQNYKNNSSMKPCLPATFRNRSDNESQLIKQKKYRDNACVYNGKGSQLCPVCYFFGAMGLPGMLYVPFLFTETPPNELYSLRLDRTTVTGVQGTNREYEFVPGGATFTGTIEVLAIDKVTNWKFGEKRPLFNKNKNENKDVDEWLAKGDWDDNKIIEELIMPALKNIKRMGGFRSKGFGKVEVTPTLKK